MRIGLLVLALSGCVSIPPYQGTTDGANAPTVRLVREAYRDGGEDSVAHGTPGMSKAGFSISADGINAGDLVVLVGSVDNGIENFWNLPDGFTELIDREFGPDTQTFAISWKIAANEPATYTGTYLPGISTSGAATITLLAIGGADPTTPIEAFVPYDQGKDDHDPIDVGSPGLTTTVDNSLLVYAAGADWHGEGGRNTFTAPDGFTQVAAFGDRNIDWDWTSETVAWKTQATAGVVPPIVASTSAVHTGDSTPIVGSGWSTLMAIALAR